MMASAGDIGVFLGGLVVGTLVGIVLGPLIRLWLTWHERKEASREARLTEDVLDRMDSFPVRPRKGRAPDGAGSVSHGPSPQQRWRPRP